MALYAGIWHRTDIGVDFLDPERNATIGVTPDRVFSMRHGDFQGSATRWVFEELTVITAQCLSPDVPRPERVASLR